MAKDSVTCLSCADIVHDEGSEAMQCDLCDQWAHIACVGVTKAAYKLAGRLKGFQWLCNSFQIIQGTGSCTVMWKHILLREWGW